MIKLKNEVEEFINTHCSKEKATYDEGLVSTSYEIKGLMNDDLVKFAKKLAVKKPKVNDFPLDYHEEIMLAGMTIAYSRMSPKEKAQELSKLLPYIDNWATCDIIVNRLQRMESQKEFFVNLLRSNRPFYIRFAIVWFKKFYLKKNVRETVNLINDNVKNTNYYVETALAWCYADALVLDYDYMIDFTQKLERFIVRNRTLQKACESTRITPEQKVEIRKIRSKLLGMEI